MGCPSLCPTSLSSLRDWVDDHEAGRKGDSDLTQAGQRKAIRSKGPEAKPEVLLRGLQIRSSVQFRGAGEGRGAGGQGGLLKGHMVYRKGMEWEEPGSGPPSLNHVTLAIVFPGPHFLPLKNGEVGQTCRPAHRRSVTEWLSGVGLWYQRAWV